MRQLTPAALLAAVALLALPACDQLEEAVTDLRRTVGTDRAPEVANGDGGNEDLVAEGAALIDRAGCGTCHMIPGIKEADGLVGPPLDHMARRIYITGMLRNTPANMVTWLRDPQAIVPGNAMPDMGLSEAQARAITASLDTLD